MTQTDFARNKVKIFLAAAVLFLSLPAFSAERCESLFSQIQQTVERENPNRYGQIKSSFNHNTKYKVLLPELTQIKNQCGLGTCHLHSWVSALEHNYAVQNADKIKISTHYLSARHWLEASIDAIGRSDRGILPNLGLSVYASKRAIRMYGIIPDEAWNLPRDFQDPKIVERTQEYIKNIIGRANWQIEREVNSDRKNQIKQETAMEVIEIFNNVVGKMPWEFTYRGREYTPITFSDRFFPELSSPLVTMVASKAAEQKTILEGDSSITAFYTQVSKFEPVARELIDKGQSVYLGYSHNHQFVDNNTGIMSIEAFNAPKGSAPLSREQREYFNVEDGGHGVQIVGYDIDPSTGRVSKWKIKNSWGEEKGDKGYYHMYADYFNAFALSISFYRDAGVKLPRAEQTLPKQLDLGF